MLIMPIWKISSIPSGIHDLVLHFVRLLYWIGAERDLTIASQEASELQTASQEFNTLLLSLRSMQASSTAGSQDIQQTVSWVSAWAEALHTGLPP